MFYTGVGSRNIPSDIYEKMYNWGKRLAYIGYTLRSGGANGADTAFERGCDIIAGKKEIYLPWRKFNQSNSTLYNLTPEAEKIAANIYGTRWKLLKDSVKKLMIRNMYQIMGYSLNSPSSFVICWTPDGCTTSKSRNRKTGGTGQAISYAHYNNIPIFNFKNKNDENKLIYFLQNENLLQ